MHQIHAPDPLAGAAILWRGGKGKEKWGCHFSAQINACLSLHNYAVMQADWQICYVTADECLKTAGPIKALNWSSTENSARLNESSQESVGIA